MSKYRIMVVDDSRVICAEMKKMLEGSDIEIIGYCRSGEEALEQYGTMKPDLVWQRYFSVAAGYCHAGNGWPRNL